MRPAPRARDRHSDVCRPLLGAPPTFVRAGGYARLISREVQSGSAKMYYMEHLARQQRVPLVRLIAGAGGSVRTNAARHSGSAIGGAAVSPYVDLLGTAPVVSAALRTAPGPRRG